MRCCFTILFISATWFAGRTCAQEDTAAVEAIHRIVKEINGLDKLQPKVLENEAFLDEMTDRGGVLTAWLRKGRVVLLMEWVGLSSCEQVTAYYFSGSELVFVEVKGSESAFIDSTGSFDHRVQRTTMEARFYFQRDEVLKAEMSGSTRCGGAPGTDGATAYRMRATKFVELFGH
jgi:hypothetical protein